jgi:hypothetical protein
MIKMRKILAAFLLVCLGILLPLAASPLRFCLMQGGAYDFLSASQECCTDCQQGSEPAPCCVELEKLPDISPPLGPLEVPPAVLVELGEISHPVSVRVLQPPHHAPVMPPIRGPTTPSAFRAVIGIWRL